MRKLAAFTLMFGCSLAVAPMARAEEARVDVIFTGVVPPTCVVEAPSNTIADQNRQDYTFQTDGSAQVVCNDGAQVNTGEFTSAAQSDLIVESNTLEADSLQTNSQEFLTITAP